MKKFLVFFIAILFFISCEKQITQLDDNLDLSKSVGQVSLNIDMSQAPSDVTELKGILTRSGYDTIAFDFEIESNSAYALVEDIFCGEWKLTVNAYNSEGIIIYTGSTFVNVFPGTVTQVKLHLNPTTGDLEIIVTWGNGITVTDIDGNEYKTVQIGNQLWMAENLKVTRYRNGDYITDGTGIGDYSNEEEPKYCFAYNDEEDNVATYGRLYTWYVVNDTRKISPEGWHIPSDEEWKELSIYLGMDEEIAELICVVDSNDISGKLKEEGNSHWFAPNVGATNESGFTALPGGYRRRYSDNFDYLGSYACFWATTEQNEEDAWYRHLYNDEIGICRTYNLKNYGFSVRCIKD